MLFILRILTAVAAMFASVVAAARRHTGGWSSEESSGLGTVEIFFIIFLVGVILLNLFGWWRSYGHSRSGQNRRKGRKPRTGFFENTLDDASANDDFDFRSMREFMKFLTSYNRLKQTDTSKRFSPFQKKMLEDFFLSKIVPNQSVPVADKEEMRKFLCCKVGISALLARPHYCVADMDSRLTNDKTEEEERAIKDSGNLGESLVRSVLGQLKSTGKYEIHHGVQVCLGFSVHEFDHIVCSDGVVFMLETKAYTLNSSSSFNPAVVRILKDGTIEATKFGNTKIHDPREQIMTDAEMMEKIVGQQRARVEPVLVIANQQANIINECDDYPCKVLQPKDIAKYIERRMAKVMKAAASSKAVPTASELWLKIRERTVLLSNFDKNKRS